MIEFDFGQFLTNFLWRDGAEALDVGVGYVSDAVVDSGRITLYVGDC